MTTTFKGYATTSTLIDMDEYVAVQMPSNVAAGDYLVAMMGNVHQTALDPSASMTPAGWTQLSGQAYIYYKVADGSEGGTTVDFRTFPSFPSPWTAGARRVFLGVVHCYNFTTPPIGITRVDATRNFSSSPNPFTDAVSGTYGQFMGGDVETRVYACIGAGNDEDFISYPLDGYTWTNATDRSGITSHAKGDGILEDTLSIITADSLDMPPFSSSQRVNLTLEGDSFYGVGGDLFGVRFVFSLVEPTECLQYFWGYGTTAGDFFDFDLNKSETGGYVRCGGFASEYPVGPITGESLQGALIIATVRRYTWTSSTPPPRGTLSGFGATWDLISYETAVGNGGAAFTEIYRTMQPTYGPFPTYAPFPAPPPTGPDGFLTYTFPPNADLNFSSVGWKSFLGADPAGLADNGASAIQNLTTFPATTGVGGATFTHPSAYREGQSILWTSFRDIIDSTSGGAATSDMTRDEPVLVLTPTGFEGYGAAVLNHAAQEGTVENVSNFDTNFSTIHYRWEAGRPRTWWAATLEILLDPNVNWCLQSVAYWGILVTPA